MVHNLHTPPWCYALLPITRLRTRGHVLVDANYLLQSWNLHLRLLTVNTNRSMLRARVELRGKIFCRLQGRVSRAVNILREYVCPAMKFPHLGHSELNIA